MPKHAKEMEALKAHLGKHQLPDGERLQATVAQQAHIQFPPLDVFLGDDVAVVLLVDELDAVPELVVGLDEGGLADAVGGLLLEGLDQDGEAQPGRPGDALAARQHGELRHMDAVIPEDLLRDALVLAARLAT